MRLSDAIEQFIKDLLNEESSEVELKRNELAEYFGCAPSQINYVLATRFSPDHGYLTESRRGGGGYIKISRIHCDRGTALMHAINAIGDAVDERTCRSHLINLVYLDLLSERDASLILAAAGDGVLRLVEPQRRDAVRAAIVKQMLLTLQA